MQHDELLIPDIDLSKFISRPPGSKSCQRDAEYLFLGMLLSMLRLRKRKGKPLPRWCKIDAARIKRLVGKNLYSAAIDRLREAKFIDVNDSYAASPLAERLGVDPYPKAYRLTRKLAKKANGVKWYQPSDKAARQRLKEWNSRERMNQVTTDRARKLAEVGSKYIKLPKEEAERYVKEKTYSSPWSRLLSGRCVSSAASGDFRFVEDRYSRLHSELVRTPEVIRRMATIDNKPVIEVDVKNSQPVILCKLMMDDGIDPGSWQTFAESGELYEVFTQGGEMTRQQTKKATLVYLYGSTEGMARREKTDSEAPVPTIRRIIKERFPEIYEFVEAHRHKHTKKKNRTAEERQQALLAHRLQRMEAEIVLEAAVRLCRRGIWAGTIHDGIMVQRGNEQEAIRELLEGFETAGLRPTIAFKEQQEQ